jgi:dCMP deaminase
MNVARGLAYDRSHDPRLQVCAIVVPEDNTGILAMGYNGDYRGGPNAIESLDPGKSGTIHAEQNALVKCPFHFPMKKHMYLTHSPCIMCSKLIINAGLSRVVYDQQYRDLTGLDLLRSAGIEVMDLNAAIFMTR